MATSSSQSFPGGFLYKPAGSGSVGGGNATFLLNNSLGLVAGSIYDSSGNQVEKLKSFQAVPEPGQAAGPPGIKFYGSKPGNAYGEGFTAKFADKNGNLYSFDIGNSSQRYEGDFNANGGDLKASSGLGSIGNSGGGGGGGGGGGSGGGGSAGIPPGFAPGNIGFGSFPAFLGGKFPKPQDATFNYNLTDPFQFAKDFGQFNRDEVTKNAQTASNITTTALQQELSGLQSFAPAASALRRDQISADNSFNQTQRTQQVNQALPTAQADLTAQNARANTYASGSLPDAVSDRALDINAASKAADQSFSGGFGANSSVNRKITDLLSADQRLQIAQYGEGLLSSNINQQAGLFLAPTEYSNAGSQIPVAPAIGGSQIFLSSLGDINQLSSIPATSAFSQQIGQQQFLSQGNAQTSQFNAQTNNQFSLDKFGYLAGFANSVSNANQINTNTGLALNQQAQAAQIAAETQNAAQGSLNAGAIGQLGGAALGAIGSLAAGAGAGQVPSAGGGSGGGGGQVLSGSTTQSPGQPLTTSGGLSVGGQQFQPGSSVGGPSGSIVIPQGQQPPSGFTGVSTTPTGSTIAIPSNGSASGGATFGTPNSSQNFGNASSPPIAPPPSNPEVTGIVAGVPTGESSPPPLPPPQEPAAPITEGTSAEPLAPGDSFNIAGQELQIDPFVRSLSARGLSTAAAPATMQSFVSATGITPQPSEQLQSVNKADQVLADAGIHPQPGPGRVLGASNAAGNPTFVDTSKVQSNNPGSGTQAVAGLVQTLNPLGVLTAKDQSTLGKVASTAGDVGTIASLNQLAQSNDARGFINLLGQKLSQPLINSITSNQTARGGLTTAYSAYNLFQNWNQMSDTQKALGVASLGIQGVKLSTGEDLSLKQIVAPTTSTVGLTIGQGLGLIQAGYNIYGLAQNWNQLNGIQKVAYGTQTVAGVASLAKNLGLLGSGTTNAAVSGVTAQSLSAAGFTPAPAYGVGAISAKAGTQLPSGYSQISTQDGNVIAGPTSTLGTALQGAAGAASLAIGAKAVYSGWGEGGKNGLINGALGGTSMAAGLSALSGVTGIAALSNPFLLGGVVALSIAGNVMKTGKSEDQLARDGVRSNLQKTGLVDSNYAVTLADGTKVNVGADGSDGEHGVFDSSKLTDEHSNVTKLHSYDSDYTNDLDFTASLGGVALSRLTNGGISKSVDQLGHQLGNAALGNIGYGQEYSSQNYSKLMSNMRAMYSQAGVKTKADGYALANQAFAEHRISESDLVATQGALNLVFDPGSFSGAQALMQGRWAGVRTASQDHASPPTTTVRTPNGYPLARPGQPENFNAAANMSLPPGFTIQPLASKVSPTAAQLATDFGLDPSQISIENASGNAPALIRRAA